MRWPAVSFTLGACVVLCLVASGGTSTALGAGDGENGESHSRLSDVPRPLATIPSRPRPILELGDHFLGTGTLSQGFRAPGGAVWQPAFMLFGTYRTALQTVKVGDAERFTEWTNRFDLFGNLNLTFTERFLIGLRPMDRDGEFTSVQISPDAGSGGQDRFNAEITTLFFEGDFGELLPSFDDDDSSGLDFGLAVGRQPISFQEGMLINDQLDAVGITKANTKPFGLVNLRWTLLAAWNQIHRPTVFGNVPDDSAFLVGLFTESDTRRRTVEVDVAYVGGDELTGDGVFFGVSSISRSGSRNLAVRALGSLAMGDEALAAENGALLFTEYSWTPKASHNFFYTNGFVGIERFRSAARGPAAGGPVGRTGILFAPPGIGRYPAALGSDADASLGGAFGYQMFFANTRRHLVLEVGGRYGTDEGEGSSGFAGGARYQMALGKRWVVAVDGFGGTRRLRGTTESQANHGVRFEFVTKL